MLTNTPSWILILAAVGLISGCVNFKRLDADLERLEETMVEIHGDISAPESIANGPILLVAVTADTDAELIMYRVQVSPGPFFMMLPRKPARVFAFVDRDRDFTYDAGEPYGWANGAKPFDPGAAGTADLQVVLQGDDVDQPSLASMQSRMSFADMSRMQGVNIGVVTRLDDSLFSAEQAARGLWEPYAFLENGGVGIHFLDPYNPDKIPVLYVHGINGSPQNFTAMVDHLDRSRYQPWVLSYPSGLRIGRAAYGLYQMMQILEHRYQFAELHVVAHSMGGLVSRGWLNRCSIERSCPYLASYLTIATPWGGASSAASGVEHAPVVVPVWYDMVPDSEYLQGLFEIPLPNGLPHYLVFAFKRTNMIGSANSDGAVTLASQLRVEAQNQAADIRGINESHVEILVSQEIFAKQSEILESAGQK